MISPEIISKRFNLSYITARLLLNRNIKTVRDIEKFLNSTISDLSEPFKIPFLDRACEVLAESIRRKEKIFIYGDGDVDGICSVYLLIKFLKRVGADYSYYLTHRLEDYEIKEEIIENLKKEGFSLLITVDCGITSIKAMEKAEKVGLNVIVIDHHKGNIRKLPPSHIYVNPSNFSLPDFLNNLSASGLTFKFLQGLARFFPGVNEKEMIELIDIVCLGVVGDNSPLIGENRVIVKQGLERINFTTNKGLAMFMDYLGIKECDLNAISMKLNPKLNSPGRFGKPEISLELFCNENEEELLNIIREIEAIDRRRYNLTSKAIKKIKENIEEGKFFFCIEGVPASLSSIVASRISEEYGVPVIVGVCKEGEIQCSARSPSQFDVYSSLLPLRKYFHSFGGHSNAVGFKMYPEFLEIVKKEWERIVEEQFKTKSIEYDMIVDIEELSPSLIKEFSILEPFGYGNPEPVFLSKGVKIERIIREEEKMKRFWVRRKSCIFESIIYNSKFSQYVVPLKEVDILYTPRMKEIDGMFRIYLEIKEIRDTLRFRYRWL